MKRGEEMNAIDKIKGKFKSGNSIPIDQAVIKKHEWEEIKKEYEEMAARVERLRKCAIESQGWDWLTAQDCMASVGIDQYEIDEMQELYEIVHDETPSAALARVRAEVVREARDACCDEIRWFFAATYDDLTKYAQRLIDEAGE